MYGHIDSKRIISLQESIHQIFIIPEIFVTLLSWRLWKRISPRIVDDLLHYLNYLNGWTVEVTVLGVSVVVTIVCVSYEFTGWGEKENTGHVFAVGGEPLGCHQFRTALNVDHDETKFGRISNFQNSEFIPWENYGQATATKCSKLTSSLNLNKSQMQLTIYSYRST